jgi:hypothetical protein
VLIKRIEGVASAKRRLPCQQFVEQRAEGVQIGAGVGWRTGDDQLGGHILGRAEDHAVLCEARRVVGVAGDAEVDQLDVIGVAVERDAEAVLRLDVAVDRAALVRRRQAAADLHGHRGDPRPGERTFALHEVLEVLAGEVLHHDEELAARKHAYVVGAHDVVALDLHHRARLLQAAPHHVWLVRKPQVDQLDR